jgi:hypothetical protein
MKGSRRRIAAGTIVLAVLLGIGPLSVAAEDPASAQASSLLGFGMNMGTDVLVNPDTGRTDSYTKLGIQPDLSFGKFGMGLDLSVRVKLAFSQTSNIEFYKPDWIPSQVSLQSILDLYLPKIMYVRYGKRGADPLYAKLGSIDDLTLGNGFIVGNYANTNFLPTKRLFGASAGLDGALFQFPIVGVEGIAGNLAQLDVVGGRAYVRPLAIFEIPILSSLQVGATMATDTNPELYATTKTGVAQPMVYGADFALPIFGGDIASLAAFGDAAFQPNSRSGYMVGFGGRLIGLFTYGAQLRILSPGFIPAYFDANYDIYRAVKARILAAAPSAGANGVLGWYAAIGTNLLDGKVMLNASLDGPFAANPATPSSNQAEYPHLKGVFSLAEGLVGGISVDASYEKYFLGKNGDLIGDVISPQNAVIGAKLNYKTGAAVLSLIYSVKYNPATSAFDVSSSLETAIKF